MTGKNYEKHYTRAVVRSRMSFRSQIERWHPKAAEFIWAEKDGIHIIDLAKSKAGLDAAMTYLYELGSLGSTVILSAPSVKRKVWSSKQRLRQGQVILSIDGLVDL